MARFEIIDDGKGTARVKCVCGWSMGFLVEYTPQDFAIEVAGAQHPKEECLERVSRGTK